MVEGMVKPKPLNKAAKALRLQLRGELKGLHGQLRAIQKSIEMKQQTTMWLESPWDYGDIVESIPFPRNRAPECFVVVAVSYLSVWGRKLADGVLAQDKEELSGEFLDDPVGRYSSDGFMAPPEAAKWAMEAKGTL